MFGIAFDPDRPLVATSAFPDGTVAAGEVFDWRAKGLQAIDALAMFRSGLVTHPPEAVTPLASGELEAAAPEAQAPVSAEPEAPPLRHGDDVAAGERRTILIDGQPVVLTAGETISVRTPAQQALTRAERRALRSKG